MKFWFIFWRNISSQTASPPWPQIASLHCRAGTESTCIQNKKQPHAAGQPRGVQRGGRRSTRERRPPGPSRQHGAERGEPSDVHEQHTARGLRRGQAGPGREVTVSAPNAGLWPHVEGWKVDWSLTPELVLPKHGLACALPYKPRLWDTGGLCQASTWRGHPAGGLRWAMREVRRRIMNSDTCAGSSRSSSCVRSARSAASRPYNSFNGLEGVPSSLYSLLPLGVGHSGISKGN